MNENERIAKWFLNDYYSGMSGERGATGTFELCRALRLQISTLANNEYVKNIMIPSEDSNSTVLDFNKTLENKTVVAISNQQQKLGNVGKHMGYLITECFQNAIFRRPGSDATRVPNMVYINQFELFATPALGNVLTMGRAYRVSLNLAVDSRDCIIPGETINPGSINGLKSVVDANTRNKIIYPSSYEDAVYYQNHFVSIFSFYKNEKTSFKDKLSNIFKDNYKEEDFMAGSILNREYATFTATLIKNNAIQSPVIVKTKK